MGSYAIGTTMTSQGPNGSGDESLGSVRTTVGSRCDRRCDDANAAGLRLYRDELCVFLEIETY
jgi:hypothetical protein